MEWSASYTDIAKNQLVACVTVAERKEAKVCNYQGTYKLRINVAKYNVKLYEAQTGTLVAEKNFALSAEKKCPPFVFFSESEETCEPDYTQGATDFLKPFVKH